MSDEAFSFRFFDLNDLTVLNDKGQRSETNVA